MSTSQRVGRLALQRADLVFHLGELSADLRLAAAALGSADPPDRRGVSTAASLVEHDLDHHLPEVHRLLARKREPAVPEVSVDRATLARRLAAMAGEFAAFAADPDVAADAALPSRHALEAVHASLTAWQRELTPSDPSDDPAAAFRVVDAVDARTLTACPRCGEPLSSGDRTFDGTLCESCGTHWTVAG